jgi:HSP20 family protein
MLTRWNDLGTFNFDPGFAALNGLRQEMDRLFQRFEHDWPGDGPSYGYAALESQPLVYVRDAGDDLEVSAEVPGFKPEDLHVSYEGGSLVIRGERQDEVPEGYSIHRKERTTVRFARAFTLPTRVDPDKIEASLRDGILELRLPKAAEERPRTISVKTT